MTAILFLATFVLGVLLFETRGRLARLEQRVLEHAPWPQPHYEPPVEAPVGNLPPVPEPLAAPEPWVAPPPAPDPIFVPAPQEQPVLEAPAPAFPQEEPAFEPEPALAEPAPSGGFEDLFGRKLPIWAGGITLLVTAVLLVKYSIDAGLLAPIVRVTLGALFGFVLIGGAEIARRKAELVGDDRIPQALAGAGVGALYAATLAAANLYELIGPGTAFTLLAVITAAAMLLAIRFGAPTAVLALVGGLATPALVSSIEPNVPLLCGYLALVVGGLTLLSRRQRWFWLGVVALAGGGGWTALLILAGGLSQMAGGSVGLLVLMIGLAMPLLASADRRGPVLHAIGAVVAALQLALLVATGGFTMLSWGLYGLLAAAFVWLTGRLPAMRMAMGVPLLTALLLAALWPAPTAGQFALVMAGIAAIFGGSALSRLWRTGGGLFEAGQIVVTALFGFAVTYWQFGAAPTGQDTRSALLTLAFAALPAAGAVLGLRRKERHIDQRFAMLVLASGLLLLVAAVLGLPAWTIPVSAAIIASALLVIGERTRDGLVRDGAVAWLIAGLLALPVTGAASSEFARLAMAMPFDPSLQTVLRWSALLAAACLFGWRFGALGGAFFQVIGAVLAYGLIAQFVPAVWLAIAAAVMLVLAAEGTRRAFPSSGTVCATVFATIAGLWALEPFGRWLFAGVTTLVGEPMLVVDVAAPGPTLQRLLVPALLGVAALWRMHVRLPRMAMAGAAGVAGAIGLGGLHILYKQVFAMADMEAFIRLGLAERTLWQALIIGAGVALWRLRPERREGFALIAVGGAHNLYYSMLFHNPLWAEQAVGGMPILNLLLPAFGIAFALPSIALRLFPKGERPVRAAAAMHMVVLLLFAFATLRQAFCGSILIAFPVGQVENILWSVLLIALGVGYLLWGIRTGQRTWRIGSLLLMLTAVAKVFLGDAAGLEGLLRIASFLTLGLSLIGIGWLYSRYLKPDVE